MNNAKIWLVVPPAAGVPIFLGAVVIGSLAVHLAVLSKTNWYEDFLLGQRLGTTAEAQAALVASETVARASFGASAMQGETITVILPDGTTTTAIIQSPEVRASAETPMRVALE